MKHDKPTTNAQRELFDWWQQNHSTDDAMLLTGSRGIDVWEELNVVQRIVSGKTILNIGVGLGYCTRELAERKSAIVHALDISEVALDRVKDVVACTWRPDQFADFPTDTFDLAISHLVTQHMGNNDVVNQMRAVIKSLKTGGVFAMQFAYSTDPNYVLDDRVERRKWGSVCRTLEEMSAMVTQAGGRIVWIHKDKKFPEWKTAWYGIHIVKDNDESVRQYLADEHRFTISRHFIEAGLQMIEMGSNEKALNNFAASIEINKENCEAYYYSALMCRELEKNEEALNNFRKALSLRPDDRKTILELGKLLVAERKIDQARELWLNYLKANPEDSEVRELLVKDNDETLRSYLIEESQKTVLNDRRIVRMLSYLLSEIGEIRSACHVCSRYLEQYPNELSIRSLVQQMETLLQERADKSQLLLQAGEDLLINQQDENSAMEAFLKAIELDRECHPAYNDLAIIYLNQQKFDLALAALKKATELDAENELYLENYQQVAAIVQSQFEPDEGAEFVLKSEALT
jgi:tetratricopeptide (TPR) repeat protein